MNWSEIGKLVGGAAPVLGTILGGPLGGLAGSLLGGLLGLGGSSGTEITPETVQAAIAKGGDVAIAAIQQAEQEAAAKWGYLTQAVQSDAAQSHDINETIRAEIGHVSWYHWRNLLGYTLLPWMLAPIPIVTTAIVKGNADQVKDIINIATALLPYFTINAALLGYVAADTTRRVTTAVVGEHAPSIFGDLVSSIIKKKK